MVNIFLKNNHKNDPKVLFREMDKDGNGVIDLPEFLHYFKTLKNKQIAAGQKESQIDKQMSKEKLTMLY